MRLNLSEQTRVIRFARRKGEYMDKSLVVLMARVKIRFFGMLREIAGKREETLQLEDSSSAIDLIRELSSKHGKRFSEVVFDKNGNLREGFAYAINGDTLNETRLASIECSDIQEFVILPPISGG